MKKEQSESASRAEKAAHYKEFWNMNEDESVNSKSKQKPSCKGLLPELELHQHNYDDHSNCLGKVLDRNAVVAERLFHF